MIKHWRVGAVFVLSLIGAWFLFVFIEQPLFDIALFDKKILNFYMAYEFSTIIISLVFLFALYLLADKLRLSYFNLKRIDRPVRPAPLVGIKPKEGIVHFIYIDRKLW